MAGAQCAATAGPRAAAPPPPLLLALLLLCAFLCAVLVLLAPAARQHGDDSDETEELPAASSPWGRRDLPRPPAAYAAAAWRPRPRGRWNSAGQGLRDGKHEVPSGPNPDSNR